MSKRAGVRRFGATFVAAVAVASMALFLGGNARAAVTIAVHSSPALDCAVDGFPSAASCSSSGFPVSAAGDTINLDAGANYALLHAGDVTHNLTIQTDPAQLASGGRAGTITGGSITGSSTVDPGSQLDVFAVAAGQTLTVHNINITGTLQPSNGGIVLMGPTPAVGTGATLLMDHSLMSSTGSNGVDVMAGAQATITNSTITQMNGFDGVLLDGTATLNEDTIANNGGNGIDNHGGGVATVFNTILSGNTLGNCFFAITGAFGSGSNSDDSGTSCGATITTGGASSTGTGIIAASATNNGGPTNTYALPAASVAINHGTGSGAAATDQRGFLRDATPDVGAYEFGGTQPATLFVIKHVVGPGSASNFQITVNGASANPGTFPGQESPGTAVTVASGQTYTVSETPNANYTSAQSGNCTGPIAAGQTGTCTLTNTAKPFNLLVTKTVDNTGGGTGSPADFTMTVTDTTNPAASPPPFAGSVAGTTVQIPAGDNYTVTESADAAQSGKYTSANSGPCSGSAAINGSGTCAFTNTFLACPQTGLQPNQSNTCVNATVNATIIVTSPSVINFPALGATETSAPIAVPVNVKSNNPTGYQLSATRTAFTNGDIPLSISGAAVSAPQAYDAPLPALTPIPVGSSAGATLTTPPTGPNLTLGHSGAITPAAGDNWPFSFVLGPVPFGIPAGSHVSVVTFTAIAT